MMKVPFLCYLIGVIFSHFTLGEDKFNCTRETKREELCCGGDVFQIAESIWSDPSCNVEPKNATLTFADSAWLAYHCNIRNRLNSTKLTLQSYMSLLLRVSNSSQSVVWNALPFQSKISENTVGDDEYDKIQTIKLYQRQYLHAVEQACIFNNETSTSGNTGFNLTSMNAITKVPGMKYSEWCNEEILPYSAYFAGNGFSDTMYDHYKKCLHAFNQTLGKSFSSQLDMSIFVFCRATSFNYLVIKTQISRPTLDFEGIVRGLSPAFWSKSVKNSVKDWVFNELKQEFETQDLETLDSLMRHNVEERVNHEISKGESVTNKREVVQALMILHISDIFETTETNVCGFDASRRVNSGV